MTNLKPLPPTRDGYRYCWGEDDEPLCAEYIAEFNKVEANKRVGQPTFLKRRILPSQVRLSQNDRAPQLKLDDTGTRVTGEKGYSMVRATHGMNRGKFYFEVYIDSMPENTAARIGWSQYYSNLQAPLGYDHYGYSWRSKFGSKFHQARGKTFDRDGGYRQGDTIGCMIELPTGNRENKVSAHHLPKSIKETGSVVTAKGKKDAANIRMIEEHDSPPPLTEMIPLGGSKISFYKNGRFVGIAFENIFDGIYYPSISLYKTCTVTANFGPKFKFPPGMYNAFSKNHLHHMSVQDMVEICTLDNLVSDMIYIVSEEAHESGENKLREKIKSSIQG